MPSYTEGTGGEVLPEGSEWAFVVENATETESSNGNEMIALELRILGPNGERKGLVYNNLVFTEKAFWRIDIFREATGDKLVPGQQVVFNADDAIDRKGRVVLNVDTFQGRSKNKVDHYVVPGNGAGPAGATAATPPPTTPAAAPVIGKPGGIPF